MGILSTDFLKKAIYWYLASMTLIITWPIIFYCLHTGDKTTDGTHGWNGMMDIDFHLKSIFPPNVRLPENVTPTRYELYLIPFIIPGNFTIKGEVHIDLNISSATTNLTVHVYDMKIHEEEVKVTLADGSPVEVVGHSYDKLRQFYIVKLGQELSQTSARLTIFWTGNLNDQPVGFYRSSYTDKEGVKQYLATTQFEPTHARRAFPCFDEPAMKAVFQVNLGRLPEMSSISNMPIQEAGVPIGDTGYVWDEYQDSVIMSTYLLAFVVSDFVFRTSKPLPNGVEFRIWAREEARDQTEWASDIGPPILAYFEDYFNVSYSLPKQDMIAIPDFRSAAMENWGLITYREEALLYQEGVSSLSDKEYVATVVAHELAHQWFGNLVTMEWWNDIWLNEGFANYAQYIGANHVLPENEILDRFVLDSLQPALGYDSHTSSHPISNPVDLSSEIKGMFDIITYKKGGSVIRMMAHFLKLDTFNKGIKNYLRANAYSNTNQDDLWQSLTEAGQEDGRLVGLTVKEIMDTWTVQMGYPVVTIERDYKAGKAMARQQRFLLTPDSGDSNHTNSYSWWVPLSFSTPSLGWNQTSPNTWLDPATADTTTEISLGEVKASEPLVVNVQQTGFYRVNYDSQNWELLSNALIKDHQAFHRINRAQILDDAFNLARAGILDYPTALRVTEYLKEETDYIPWKAAINELLYLVDMMKRSPGFGELKHYLLEILQPLYDRLGFQEKPGETFLEEKLRILMVSTLCRLDHPECNQYSINLMDQWMSVSNPDTENPIPTSVRDTVLCSAIANGNETTWTFLWTRYNNSNNGNEKISIMKALACSTEVWILERYLEMFLIKDSGVRKQDSYSVIVGVSENLVGRYIAWNWIKDNWERLSNYYSFAIISAVVNHFNTALELDDLEMFIVNHKEKLGSAGRNTKQSIKDNIKWMDQHYQTIVDWLAPS